MRDPEIRKNWEKFGLEGGRDLCIIEGPKRSSAQSVIFICRYYLHGGTSRS